MISIKNLLNMVTTEAFERGPEDSHFDVRPKTNLPPIRYDLELIEQQDGSYKWME